MRKPEQKLWDDLSKAMHNRWEADRIENRVTRNMPDLYFMIPNDFCGFIELKQIFRWNPRKLEITRVPNLTPMQKKWLRDHHKAGENCWLLLEVRLSNEYLFIPGNNVSLVGSCTQAEMYSLAYETFQGMPTAATIRDVLRSRGEEK